ncbi:MAG: TetR/AcrR family transcriptional regulator [Ancalomicrobiaceae bacterium]|nr:TetR/AcrR family transcriptional regulator [Ancalomicrobiaceae bacterium]
MRVSRERVRQNHRQMVESAGRLFRECGIDRVSLATISADAGLTNGGFYRHFASKQALVAASLRHLLVTAGKSVKALMRQGGRRAVAEAYLSPEHAEDIATGCAFVALAAEVRRLEPETRQILADGLDGWLRIIAQPDGDRDSTIAFIALLVGGLTLARAAGPGQRAEEILAAARAAANRI